MASEDADRREELEHLLALSTPRRRHHYRRMAELSQAVGDANATSPDDAEFAALLAEYESLRQESMNTVNNRIQVLVFGAAAIAALVGGALTIDKPEEHKLLVWALFSLAVPIVYVFILLVWVSEATRSHRVGSFLAGDVEAKINAKLGRLVLCWEAALWTGALPRDERRGPSSVALAIIGVVAVSAPVFGLAVVNTDWLPLSRWVLQLSVPYGLLLGTALYMWRLMPRLKNTDVVVSIWPGDG